MLCREEARCCSPEGPPPDVLILVVRVPAGTRRGDLHSGVAMFALYVFILCLPSMFTFVKRGVRFELLYCETPELSKVIMFCCPPSIRSKESGSVPLSDQAVNVHPTGSGLPSELVLAAAHNCAGRPSTPRLV